MIKCISARDKVGICSVWGGGTGGFRVKGRGLKNNSLLSAGVLGKEQVRRYPFQLLPDTTHKGGQGAESP